MPMDTSLLHKKNQGRSTLHQLQTYDHPNEWEPSVYFLTSFWH